MSALLLRQVRIVPLDAADPASPPGPALAGPVDVLTEDGMITAITQATRTGASGRRMTKRGEARTLNGDGRWLIPGLWDAHVHLGQWAIARRRLDLSRAASPEEVLALVGQASRDGRAVAGPIVGTGQRAGTWNRQVTIAELDAVCATVPVILINSDFHHGWLNTPALDALGLPRRDTVVAEAEWFAAYPRVTVLEGAPSPADYRQALASAAARGVAGLVDFEFGAPWSDWARRWHDGCDLLRVRWSPYPDQLDDVRAAGLRTGATLPGANDRAVGARDRLTVGSLKIISDGSLGTRTAWCCEPYADTQGRGAPNLPDGELATLLADGKQAGLSAATHAIGDHALETALAAYAATGATGSIEHAQLSTPWAIAELARLGLTASVQPAHLLDDRDTADRVWPDRADRCFAFRSMLDADVKLALGSDAPVAPLDPWLAIAAAVHRGQPADQPWHAEQAITTQEAIAASVDGRRIAIGQPADLALTDADPLRAAPAALRTMQVALTCVAGKVVHTTLDD